MRHGRAKAARKTLQHFQRTIGLKPPYFVLMDGTFIAAMFQHNVTPVRERVDRVLQTTGAAGPNRYCIVQTAVDELRMIHEGLKAKNHIKANAFEEALEWIQSECVILNHRNDEEANKKKEKSSKDGNESDSDDDDSENQQQGNTTQAQGDLLRYVEAIEEKPYVVASQDEWLLDLLRSKGTVPIVRLANHSVLLLENPSKRSQSQFKGMERKKWKSILPDSERALVDLVKKENRMAAKQKVVSTIDQHHHQQQQQKQKRGKGKAKGPNPLSCKRKDGGSGSQKKESASKKRRNRAKKQKAEE